MKYSKRRKWERRLTLSDVFGKFFADRATQIAANVRRHNALLRRLTEQPPAPGS